MRTIDLTNNIYGMLTVIEKLTEKDKSNHILWLCKCTCGNIIKVTTSSLRSNNTRSCGCLHKEVITTHGDSKTRLYNIYRTMLQRCYNPNSKDYEHYGERGIIICNEWKNSYPTFKSWALSNGYVNPLTIERIDCNDNYCPKNCTWIPLAEQRKNQRPRKKELF